MESDTERLDRIREIVAEAAAPDPYAPQDGCGCDRIRITQSGLRRIDALSRRQAETWVPGQPKTETDDRRARLMEIVRTRSFARVGSIILASGRETDFYFNLKPTMLDAEGAWLLAEMSLDALRGERLDRVGGLEMGAVPLTGAIAMLSWQRRDRIGTFFVRKTAKHHGARLSIEGLAEGETLQGLRVAVIEDVTTTGQSAMRAVASVREAGAEVAMVLTMVDRQEGAAETFAAAGVPFRAIVTAEEFLKT